MGVKYTKSVVKMNMTKFLKDERLQVVIEDAVQRMNHIVWEGTRLLNLVVLELLHEQQDHMPIIDMQFIRTVFTSVQAATPTTPKACASRVIGRIRDTVYNLHRPSTLPWTDGSYLGQLVSSEARQHMTNCETHVWMNLPKRLRRWMSLKLEEYEDDEKMQHGKNKKQGVLFKSSKHRQYALSYMWRCLEASSQAAAPDPPPFLNEQYDHTLRHNLLQRMHSIVNEARHSILDGLR